LAAGEVQDIVIQHAPGVGDGKLIRNPTLFWRAAIALSAIAADFFGVGGSV
jgi:hypothetical protein